MPSPRCATTLALLVALVGAGPTAARAPAPPTPGATAACRHPDSSSRSLLVLRADGYHLFMRLQVRSVLEVLPQADADGDEWLSPDELAAATPALRAYVDEHQRIRPLAPEAAPWPRRLLAASVLEQGADVFDWQQYVDLEFRADWDSLPETLVVETELFVETSPAHQDHLALAWPDGRREEHVLWGGAPRLVVQAGGGAAASSDAAAEVLLGLHHILGGWDHLLYVLTLLAASRRLSTLAGVLTAFTLAHSLTLGLSAFDLVRLPPRPVEVVIALSIAWSGAANLLLRRPRLLALEAFGFGLAHGLGFASAFGELLESSAHRLRALLCFNLGVEAGQLLVVLAALLLCAFGRRLARVRQDTGSRGSVPPPRPELGATPRPGLVPPALGRLVSLAALVSGLVAAGWRGFG